VVVDAGKQPIPRASIFLSNTSVGTRADEEGKFTLSIPHGRYDLIVSSVGYETSNQGIESEQLPAFLTISLRLKPEEMETIVIEPYEKDGWANWGQFFTDNFLGMSALSRDCKLKNPEVLRFRHSKKNSRLDVIALDALVIENRALGYTISYQLESFNFDFKTRYLVYTGYPFFQSMNGGESRKKKWERNRKDAYYGSMLHFMRSLFRNTLETEGFEVRALEKIPNTEKKRVRAVYANRSFRTGMSSGLEINKDSSEYYKKILAQGDFHDVIGRNLFTGDSIAYAIDAHTAGCYFDNYLLIIYKKGMVPLEYRQQFPKSSKAMMSQITLISGNPIEIQASGSYFNPADLMSLGYWSWSEKIAHLLPFDWHD
jgi:hypothetical protein